jgi:hypothetical protein
VIDLDQKVIAVDDIGKAIRIVSLGAGNVLWREKVENL